LAGISLLLSGHDPRRPASTRGARATHPYIAFIILSNPANHHRRPDEALIDVRAMIAAAWKRLTTRIEPGAADR